MDMFLGRDNAVKSTSFLGRQCDALIQTEFPCAVRHISEAEHLAGRD